MLDLLILGAGPAGCAAAIYARRAGLDVLILDGAERPRPAPGETLHPGVEPLFATLGVRDAILAAGFHRHRGIWIEWDRPRRFEAYGEDAFGVWRGFQADRRKLLDILLRTILDLGLSPQRPITLDELIVERDAVRGVVAGGRALRARWTADATGRSGWLARRLGLVEDRRSPSLHARFGWSEDPAEDDQPCLQATTTGWTWRAPLGGRRSAWVSLDAGSKDAKAGTDVSWRVHRTCAGPGYFLLGDAAATLDPLSSHGVLRAVMSGILCGHRVVANLVGGAASSEIIDDFAAWTSRQFDHDVEALRTLYQCHPSKTIAAMFRDGGPDPQAAT